MSDEGSGTSHLYKMLYSYYLEFRGIVSRYDWLYWPFINFLALTRPDQKSRLVSKKTEIVIEGFSRSANTYAVSFFDIAQRRQSTIAHHLHESYQIRYAERHNIPCVILFRDPLSAVASGVMRQRHVTHESLLRNYIRFYEEVLRIHTRAIVAPFSLAIQDFNSIIDAVNETYGTDFMNLADLDRPKVTEDVVERDRKDFNTSSLDRLRIAVPTFEKDASKIGVKELIELQCQQLLIQANRVYKQMQQLSESQWGPIAEPNSGDNLNPPDNWSFRKPRKVVLFVGIGRSGSTILESMLGQHLPAFPLGELKFFIDRGIINSELCGCGVPLPDCEFWGPVVQDIIRTRDRVDLYKLLDIRHHNDRNRYALLKGLLQIEPRDTHAVRSYIDFLDSIIDRASSRSGFELVIDSSKDVAHAFLMNRYSRHRIMNLHLVRHPAAVAFSWSQPKVRPEVHWKKEEMAKLGIAWTSVWWLLLNGASTMLLSRYGGMRLTYEEFCQAPDAALRGIETNLVHRRADSRGKPSICSKFHTISGNPTRFQAKNSQEVLLDERWREKMSFSNRLLSIAITWPLRKLYGYPVIDARRTP